jgi:hypothetical protein
MSSCMNFQVIIIRYSVDHWLSLRGNQENLYLLYSAENHGMRAHIRRQPDI